jgi:hypothetical protein
MVWIHVFLNYTHRFKIIKQRNVVFTLIIITHSDVIQKMTAI